MPISVTCLCCGKQAAFPESQAGNTASCPSCAAEVNVPGERFGAITLTLADQEIGARDGEAITADPAEEPVWVVELDEMSLDDEVLELGPRWRQIERAFAWVRFGVTALNLGLACHLIAALLPFPFNLPSALVRSLAFAAAGFSLLVGQLFCLRVPAGTRARPAAFIWLALRIVSFGLSIFGVGYWLDAKATYGSGGDPALLTAFALLLGGSIVSLFAEFSFLAFLKRVGLFLEARTVIRHTRRANWILIGYILVALVLGIAAIALAYQSVLEKIAVYEEKAAHNPQYHMPKANPQSWLLTRISAVLVPSKGQPPEVELTRLLITAVGVFFWIALGIQYRAALSAANATIKSGLARGATDL